MIKGEFPFVVCMHPLALARQLESARVRYMYTGFNRAAREHRDRATFAGFSKAAGGGRNCVCLPVLGR